MLETFKEHAPPLFCPDCKYDLLIREMRGAGRGGRGFGTKSIVFLTCVNVACGYGDSFKMHRDLGT